MILGLDHAGFAVKDLEESVKYYEQLGFKVYKKFSLESEGINAVMLRMGDQGIELFKISNPDSVIAQKVKHHIALKSDDIEADVQAFLENGYKVSMPIKPGSVVKKFAYVEDELGNQIEILEQEW